ncbi:Lrp/AsnC family transcriptional regulator [Candidatus Woesearchaeota archaeon]|nr:Lrp/AsnC family transcriptional regulator [Candidatus Woesearchaeota archaeon]
MLKGDFVDNLDLNIINILLKNSRTPFMQIAKKLKVSESTVRKRVSNLENNRIIKKYSLVVDATKIGFENVALIGVDVIPEKYLDIAKKLTEFNEVKYVASSTGDHMFMLEVWAKNGDELRELSEKLKALDGVTRICPAIIKDTLKGIL